jgi:hypothetical protein
MATFGGHKQSGLGAENGVEGLLEYTNPKTVVLRKAAAPASEGSMARILKMPEKV